MNRVNITIDKALHAKAVKHAKQEHFTTFSGLVYLLRRERRPLSEEELAQREDGDLTQ